MRGSRVGWAAAALGALAVALLWGLAPVGDFDIHWHLATARRALAERSLLLRDPFSFASPGPWPCKDLGGALALYAVWRAFGWAGLSLLQFACGAVAGLVLVDGARRRGASPAAAALVVPIAIGAAGFRLIARPVLFSLALLPVAVWIADRDREALEARGRSRFAWLLPPLIVLWANLHREALAGVAVAAAHAVALVAAPRRRPFRAALLLGLALAAPLCTPFGAAIFFQSARVAASETLRQQIPNWGAPTLGLLAREFPLWLGFGALAAIGFGAGARERRVRGHDWLLAAGFGAMGLSAIRFLPDLPLALAPAAAAGITPLCDGLVRRLARRGARRAEGAAAALVAVAAAVLACLPAPEPPAAGLARHWYPERALAFARESRLDGPVFNVLHYGGFLLFHGVRPLVDGRFDTVYPEDLLRAALAARRDPAAFARLDARFRFEWAFLDGRPDQRPARFLDERAGFAPVFWDDLALIYVRRDGRHGALAASRAYELLRPTDALGSLSRALARARGDAGAAARLRAEVERLLDDGPGSLEAHGVAAIYFRETGDVARARAEAAAAARIAPDHPAARALVRLVGP